MTSPQEDAKLRAKILRCLVSPSHGSVLTSGALDNIVQLIQARDEQREREIEFAMLRRLTTYSNASFKEYMSQIEQAITNPQEQDKEEE